MSGIVLPNGRPAFPDPEPTTRVIDVAQSVALTEQSGLNMYFHDHSGRLRLVVMSGIKFEEIIRAASANDPGSKSTDADGGADTLADDAASHVGAVLEPPGGPNHD